MTKQNTNRPIAGLENPFLSRDETAKLLGISVRTLNDRARQGEINKSVDGGRVFYHRDDIKKYMEKRRRLGTGKKSA